MFYRRLQSPIGELLLSSDGKALTGVHLKGQKHFPAMSEHWQQADDLKIFLRVQDQLAEYFAKSRQTFDIPLNPRGTDFQRQVWQRLHDIPFGETTSYGAIAHSLGVPGAARAVGAANGRNPISIIVPCHRVIASNGKMTGYAGGIDRKKWLLHHEGLTEKSVSAAVPAAVQGHFVF